MEVKVIGECGYEFALQGLALNKNQTRDMSPVATKLCHMDFGHNKFLESIYLWVMVRAPRYWWQEADTYRLSTKQSESTMHTLVNELEATGVDLDAFEPGSLTLQQSAALEEALTYPEPQRLVSIKKLLPEGFLQRRLWVFNYKTLRNIVIQRANHRLPHWRVFINALRAQIQHPELLPKVKDEGS